MARPQTRSFVRVAVDRIRQDRGLRLLNAVAMVVFVVMVYVAVVVGGGALLGQSGAPSLWLSVLATAIVAIAFEPFRTHINRRLSLTLHQDRMSPYQVLARFPKTVTGAYPTEELPARMARVLSEGTGTARAEVWLVVRGRLELAASWPDAPSGTVTAPKLGLDKPGTAPVVMVEGQRQSLAVRERGELLGALTVVVREGQQLSPVEGRLFAGLAGQSGLMLRVAGLRAELEQQLGALHTRTEDLRKARRDLVSRQDAERQRLERNIHDGAQQEVIALLVNLRLAQALLTRAPERGARLLVEQAGAARATIDTLNALARGLYPPLLTEAGPVTALTAAVASSPVPVDLISYDVPRCPPDVEAAVYFSALEAVQNACKHSGATRITIDVQGRFHPDGTGEIVMNVTDDGRGFDTTRRTGNGLLNISDRIECVQGSISITSAVGNGTTIRTRIPCAANILAMTHGPALMVEDQPPATSQMTVLPIAGG